jgi:ribosomal protein L11 methyltransferase
MFEPNDHGVVAHGLVGEVDVQQALDMLEEIRAFASVELEQSIAPEENWNETWEREYPKVEVPDLNGDLICTIRAPFHDASAQGMDVVVAPQMSFGTGHHSTTFLMIQAMLSLDLRGKRVLDMGCGTGVLAIVAKLAGAQTVLGIDIEEAAVVNSIDNANLNDLNVDVDFRFQQGDGAALEGLKDGDFDLVLANIHRNVLLEDMPQYARLLTENGTLLLSGFFEGDVGELVEGARLCALNHQGQAVHDGWACVRCGKPSMNL